MRNVTWPEKFKPGSIKNFDEMQNPLEFLQVYTTAIQDAGGDDKVMANYLPIVLNGSART